MDIEFDFKGEPLGGVISNCEYPPPIPGGSTPHTPVTRTLWEINSQKLIEGSHSVHLYTNLEIKNTDLKKKNIE